MDDLVSETSLTMPTLYRFLQVLQAMGYVEKNRDGRYRLTSLLFSISARSIDGTMLVGTALPYLEKLRDETQEIVVLSIRDGSYSMHLKTLLPPTGLRFYERIGKRNPLYCSSHGRVLLGGVSEEELEAYARHEPLIPYTSNTITDPIALIEAVHLTRENGYGEGINEFEQDVHSLACPVFDGNHHVVATVSLNWPLYQDTPTKKRTSLDSLKATTEQISKALQA